MSKKIIFLLKRIVLPFFLISLSAALLGSAGIYFYIKSNTEQVKKFFETEMESIIGYEVVIGSINAKWSVINPSITVNDYQILNQNHEKSIGANKIDIDFSWISLIKLKPIFDQIELYQPNVILVREKNGLLTINGITFDYSKSNTKFSNWILDQNDISVIDGQLSWIDLTKSEKELKLKNLDIDYGSSKVFSLIGRRQFSLSTFISPGAQEKIYIDGYIDIKSLEKIHDYDTQVNLILNNFELTSLKPWFDYPINIASGNGNLNINSKFEKGKLSSFSGDIEIDNINILSKNKSIIINTLKSFITLEHKENYLETTAENMLLVMNKELNFRNIKIKTNTNNDVSFLSMNSDLINLESIAELSYFFPENLNKFKNDIKEISPQGQVENLELIWEEKEQFFSGLQLKMQGKNIRLKPYNKFPGVQNLTCSLDINDNKGSIKLDSESLIFKKLDTFRENLKFDKLSGILSWKNNVLDFNNISAINSDFEAYVNGQYTLLPDYQDEINIRIDIPRADISSLTEYYPKNMGKDSLSWLDTSLLKGTADNTKIKIQGKIEDFPFVDHNNQPDESKGIFTISSTITDSEIEYGDNWPNAKNFDMNLILNGSRIEFHSDQGEILGNRFTSFKGIISDFTIDEPILNIDAEFISPLDIIVNFINNSPVKTVMQGSSDEMNGKGPGSLELSLNIPLKDIDKMTYDGVYKFQGSSLENQQFDLPLLVEIYGDLFFNQDNVSINNAIALLYDEPINLSLYNQDQNSVLDIQGYINNKLIENSLGSKWLKKINGEAKWNAQLKINENQSTFTLETDLKGITIDALADFNKTASESIPFKLIKKSPNTGIDLIDISYGNMIKAEFERDSKNTIHHGYISHNAKTAMPKKGVILLANLKNINSEDFEFIFKKDKNEHLNNSNQMIKKEFDPFIDKAQINIDNLVFEGNTITQSSFNFNPNPEGYKLNISSNEVFGQIVWGKADNLYKANFSKVHLIKEEDISDNEKNIINKEIKDDSDNKSKLSSIELIIDSFKINETNYGEVYVEGHEDLEGFVFNKLSFNTDAYILKGSGYWKSETFPQKTSINFNWDINDIGSTLNSLGYPNLIDKGESNIKGLITWDDSPANFNSEDFYGNFALIAKKGTVQKIKPGVAGRLVGLISLQNLPRRLSLDFSDLFQEGLPFDRIESKETIISKGTLSSDLFTVNGPSASISINGKINFIEETQNMRVTIQPKISDTVTAGALVGGPLAAAIAFVAQKVLDDPFNKITTAEYHVTGTWDDPKEEIIDTKVDNFIENEILNPTGEALEGTGEVIDNFLIKPTEDVIKFLFEPQNESKE